MDPFEILNHCRLILRWQNHVQIGTRWRYQGMRSTYWRLYIHSADGAAADVEGDRYPLGPGYVHFLPAWMTFDYHASRELMQFVCHFELARWTPRVTNRLAPRPVSLELDSAMQSSWDAILDGYEQGAGKSPATWMRSHALINAALASWMDQLGEQEVAEGLHAVAGQHVVEPALSYIEANLGEPIGNDELAELCHYSTDHFAKVFRQVVGQTPGRYIAERRIAAAAQDLTFTDRTIDDIAESFGFANRFYFSRAFKRQVGVPPAAYRANQRWW
ncbi:helix-turn-helix domain-containing protein [Algisphaera agarilytica]|uniref:AraC-like DNA-binding protein n=1 Tax=Algisphaera agarilytica TaxID=1385975 RepID=A0A7X0H8B1_9BACT|nr:AraC family transcriptional regulator [Algisphaera agarilytica]MBB6429670.1 AraC-like DNA-binding protein [Algisphaera agarilytica]